MILSVAEGMAKWASLHAIGVNVSNLLGGQFGNIYYCRKLIRCIYSQKCSKTRELGCSMQCYTDKGFKKNNINQEANYLINYGMSICCNIIHLLKTEADVYMLLWKDLQEI